MAIARANLPWRSPSHMLGTWLLRQWTTAFPLLLVALIWEAAARVGLVNVQVLPPLSMILAAMADMLKSGELLSNQAVTLFRSFLGLVLGVVGGTLLGVAMARIPLAERALYPIVSLTYSLPKSAIIPLAMLWLGVGTRTAVVAVFLACLLPMVVASYHGVKEVPRVLIWSARAMATPPTQLITRVILPSALPSIFSGMRAALAFSFVLAISSEMIASVDGIGKLLFIYGEHGSYAHMFGGILAVAVVAFFADRLLLAVMRRVLRWHELGEG